MLRNKIDGHDINVSNAKHLMLLIFSQVTCSHLSGDIHFSTGAGASSAAFTTDLTES